MSCYPGTSGGFRGGQVESQALRFIWASPYASQFSQGQPCSFYAYTFTYCAPVTAFLLIWTIIVLYLFSQNLKSVPTMTSSSASVMAVALIKRIRVTGIGIVRTVVMKIKQLELNVVGFPQGFIYGLLYTRVVCIYGVSVYMGCCIYGVSVQTVGNGSLPHFFMLLFIHSSPFI